MPRVLYGTFSGLVCRRRADLGLRGRGDNLRLGHTVIADSVNPLNITREAWRNVAERAGMDAVEIEVICSDRAEHRCRVETRAAPVAVTW